jgi:hypothetical protein
MSGPAVTLVCQDCGAIEFGNLTCRTCRQEMRRRPEFPVEFIDLLDGANIETIPPVGPGEIAAFMRRIGGVK